jgi:signal peptidase I
MLRGRHYEKTEVVGKTEGGKDTDETDRTGGNSAGGVSRRPAFKRGREELTLPRQHKTDVKGGKTVFRDYAEWLTLAITLALVIRAFVVQAFRIPSGSMEDTLLMGDFLLANKFIYGAKIPLIDYRLPQWRDPRPGDIIIFQYPPDPSRDFIKRCIAVAGQKVEIRDKIIYVDGKEVPLPPKAKFVDPHILPREISPRDNFGPITVPPGMLFMVGDNRDNSLDGRFWGFVPLENVKGQAMILYLSWEWDPNGPTYTGTFSLPWLIIDSALHLPWRVRWTRFGMIIR